MLLWGVCMWCLECLVCCWCYPDRHRRDRNKTPKIIKQGEVVRSPYCCIVAVPLSCGYLQRDIHYASLTNGVCIVSRSYFAFPIAYRQPVDPPQEREALRPMLATHHVVSMSYEVLRSDIEWVAGIDWDFCILDEGHTIKNAKSKIAAATKRVRSRHRLLLSGTPLQNNILELWSLFDFLMPGFLGTERQFNATYGKSLQVRVFTHS